MPKAPEQVSPGCRIELSSYDSGQEGLVRLLGYFICTEASQEPLSVIDLFAVSDYNAYHILYQVIA